MAYPLSNKGHPLRDSIEIKTIPRPEGARYCKIHHEWEKMDITSGDESAQRATSDVHLFSRVMYFCNNEPLRGGVLIIHNFF